VAIRFVPMKPGHFFLIQSWQELLCEQVRHLAKDEVVRQEMPAVFD